MRAVEKGRVNRKVVCRQSDQQCLERGTRVEWICTLPRGKEPRVAKVGGEVEVSTREAMGDVGATLTAILKAFH